jgi:hypothetical protein
MFIDKLLQLMAEKKASDIFISAGSPISIKIQGTIMPINPQPMDAEQTKKIIFEMLTPAQQEILTEGAGAQLLQAHAGPGQLPRELLLAEGHLRARHPLHHGRHPEDGRPEPAAGAGEPHHGEARPGPRGRARRARASPRRSPR